MTTIAQERAKLAAVGWRLRTREQWGARHNYTTARTMTEPAVRVFVHITVTNPSNYATDDHHARAVEAIGIARFGSGVSYNRLHMRSGIAYEGQPIGRRGTHTGSYSGNCAESGCPSRGGNVTSSNHNANGRGYVICQNVGDSVTDAEFVALGKSIAADQLAGFVVRGAPIHGHRCVSDKSCPAPLMWARMGELEALVATYVHNGLGDDDMPSPKDWTAADWEAFDKNGVTAFWFRDLSPGTETVDPAWTTVWNTKLVVDRVEKLLTTDVQVLAEAIAAHIPAGTVDLELVKQGVREVLLEGVAPGEQ